MKIVVAPNALKGSLSASAAAEAIAEGVRKSLPGAEILRVPVADGGDGLLDVILNSAGGKKHCLKVKGPLGRPLQSSFCTLHGRRAAIVEMALASGLALLPEEKRNPMNTSSFGTGELVAAALKLKPEKILLGIGGSATCDGGTGAAAALGIRFINAHGKIILFPCGKDLREIRKIDASHIHPGLSKVEIEVICDVDNSLLGAGGAARVYAPQKGAGPRDVELLEEGLANLAEIIRRDLKIEVRKLRGGGAAGGMGAGAAAFFNAKLRRGTDAVLDLLDFAGKIEGASLVITGEGRIDGQTAFGKAPAGVAKFAKKKNIPCIALCGSIGEGYEKLHGIGISAVFSICSGPENLDSAMKNAREHLKRSAGEMARMFLCGTFPHSR